MRGAGPIARPPPAPCTAARRRPELPGTTATSRAHRRTKGATDDARALHRLPQVGHMNIVWFVYRGLFADNPRAVYEGLIARRGQVDRHTWICTPKTQHSFPADVEPV